VRRAFFIVGAASAIVACGMSRLPAPPYSRQVSSAYTEVPYPPPPARVETVPDKPQGGAVWIDGEWAWEGTRWAWKRGRWVMAPTNATFSPWTSTRDPEGVLYVAEGTWRDHEGKEVPPPPELAHAKPSGGGVVDPEGSTVPPAPIIHEQKSGRHQGDGGIEDAGAKDVNVPQTDAMPLEEADGGGAL
jgi:hypothetical protein